MQLAHLALVLLSVTSIPGHPTRPLDERSTELTLQLYINDTEPGGRKKVVPKSVFIAPEFDRPCPVGMERDITGKCIKLHDLDTDGQLEFLFAKLSQHLVNDKSDEDENENPLPGPAQIHIPIPKGSYDDSNPETTERSVTTTTEVITTTDITTTTQEPTTTTNSPTTTEWYTTDRPTETTTTDSTTIGTAQYTEETTSYTTYTPSAFGDEDQNDFRPTFDTELLRIVNGKDNLRFPDVFDTYRRPERDHRYYNHRNRDKNLWEFNPPWREGPVVLVPNTNSDNEDLYRRLLQEQLSYLLRKNR